MWIIQFRNKFKKMEVVAIFTINFKQRRKFKLYKLLNLYFYLKKLTELKDGSNKDLGKLN